MAIWALIAIMVSCTDNDSATVQQGEEPSAARRAVSVEFTLSDGVSSLTRVASDTVTTPALEREKVVRNLYAVVFNASDSTFYETFIAHKKDSLGTYGYDMLQPGEYLMYLVANPADSLAARLERGVPKADSLSRMLIEQAPGNDNEATDFLMTAEGRSFKTGVDSIANVGTIKMVRAAARFDFYNRVPLLRLTRITFNNRYTTARLSTPLSTSAQAKENRGYYFFSDSTGHDIIATMYGYENLDAPATTSFTVEGFYNGVAIKPYTIQFPADKQIRRNMLYSIVLSPKEDVDSVDVNNLFGSLEYDIVVNDWSEGAEFNWLGDDLFDRSIPDFMAYGTDIHPNAALNPTKIYVESPTADTIVIEGITSTASIVRFYGKNKYGYEIVDRNEITDKDGRMRQIIKLKIPDICHSNDSTYMQFMICNKLDKTKRRIFTVVPRAKLPIEYVAEYNVADLAGTKFATNHNNQYSSALMNWNTAYNRFKEGNNKPIDGVYYHLPHYEEAYAVLSASTSYTNPGAGNYPNIGETIRVRGTGSRSKRYNYYSDYRSNGNVCYAIRFKSYSSHDNYRCAYRYQWLGSGNTAKVRITVRYLGPNQTGVAVTNIYTPSWWNTNNAGDIVRDFEMTGMNQNSTNSYNVEGPSAQANAYRNQYANYWTSYSSGSYSAVMWFYWASTTSGWGYVYTTNDGTWTNKSYGNPVRLFSDY